MLSVMVSATVVVAACVREKPAGTARPLWTHYQINAGVFDIAVHDTDVWVATDRGLIRYDLISDRVTQVFDIDSGLVSDIVTVVRVDTAGNIWVGSHGGGLSRFDGKDWTHFNVPDLADPYVYDIVFDRKGRMWVANWKGVSVYDGREWRSYTQADGIIDEWVYALALDADGAIWLGTEGGVTRFDGESFVSYTHKDGIGAGPETIGEVEFIPNTGFHHQNAEGKEAEGYNPNYILAAAVDRSNAKWFGTWGAGLSRFDGKRWKTYTVKDGLPGNLISDILVDREGIVWVATDGGIGYLQEGRWRKLTSEEGLLDDRVFAASDDDTGLKWFGTLTGISRLEGFELRGS
jgi:ligand-binding sensor domain-containing protein